MTEKKRKTFRELKVGDKVFYFNPITFEMCVIHVKEICFDFVGNDLYTVFWFNEVICDYVRVPESFMIYNDNCRIYLDFEGFEAAVKRTMLYAKNGIERMLADTKTKWTVDYKCQRIRMLKKLYKDYKNMFYNENV